MRSDLVSVGLVGLIISIGILAIAGSAAGSTGSTTTTTITSSYTTTFVTTIGGTSTSTVTQTVTTTYTQLGQLHVVLTGPTGGGQTAQPAVFSLVVSGGSGSYRSTWFWGDGSAPVVLTLTSGVTAGESHTYAASGSYLVEVDVNDAVSPTTYGVASTNVNIAGGLPPAGTIIATFQTLSGCTGLLVANTAVTITGPTGGSAQTYGPYYTNANGFAAFNVPAGTYSVTAQSPFYPTYTNPSFNLPSTATYYINLPIPALGCPYSAATFSFFGLDLTNIWNDFGLIVGVLSAGTMLMGFALPRRAGARV